MFSASKWTDLTGDGRRGRDLSRLCGHREGVDELVVHGALHLGGMDHGEDFGASEMARVSGP